MHCRTARPWWSRSSKLWYQYFCWASQILLMHTTGLDLHGEKCQTCGKTKVKLSVSPLKCSLEGFLFFFFTLCLNIIHSQGTRARPEWWCMWQHAVLVCALSRHLPWLWALYRDVPCLSRSQSLPQYLVKSGYGVGIYWMNAFPATVYCKRYS